MAQTSVDFANSKPERIYLGFPFLEKKVHPRKKNVTLGSKSASERNEVVNFRELRHPYQTAHALQGLHGPERGVYHESDTLSL